MGLAPSQIWLLGGKEEAVDDFDIPSSSALLDGEVTRILMRGGTKQSENPTICVKEAHKINTHLKMPASMGMLYFPCDLRHSA